MRPRLTPRPRYAALTRWALWALHPRSSLRPRVPNRSLQSYGPLRSGRTLRSACWPCRSLNPRWPRFTLFAEVSLLPLFAWLPCVALLTLVSLWTLRPCWPRWPYPSLWPLLSRRPRQPLDPPWTFRPLGSFCTCRPLRTRRPRRASRPNIPGRPLRAFGTLLPARPKVARIYNCREGGNYQYQDEEEPFRPETHLPRHLLLGFFVKTQYET